MARCLNCGDIVDSVVIFNRLHTMARFYKRGRLHHHDKPRFQALRSLVENI